MKRIHAIIAVFIAFLVIGCGNSSDEFVITNTNNVQPISSLPRVNESQSSKGLHFGEGLLFGRRGPVNPVC